MRRWVLASAADLKLRAIERRLSWRDLRGAEEVFMSNAVVGLKSVAVIERASRRLRWAVFETANKLRERLDPL
jgi:branched-subunit amino acid aminotransferase/4-amino-4-deoxychorismate lyase